MVRRSRCIYVIILTVLIYVIIFCVLSTHGPLRTPLSGKLSELKFDFLEFSHVFEVKDSNSFANRAEIIFRKFLISDKDGKAGRLAKYVIDGPKTSRSIMELPSFLYGNDDNPYILPHDPRLTLGILFSDFNNRLQRGEAPENLEVDVFHWADWTNLYSLDKNILTAKESKMTCKSLNLQSSKFKDSLIDGNDTNFYCFDDEDVVTMLADENKNPFMTQYLRKIVESPYKTGLHVLKCPKEAPGWVRTIAAASYLHDFMPPPMAINLIFQKSAQNPLSIHIPVNQNIKGRERLVDTLIPISVDEKSQKIDLRLELLHLISRMGSEKDTVLDHKKELTHSRFIDDSNTIAMELVKQQNLSPQDQLYLNSLRYSLSTKYPTKYFHEALMVRSERNWENGGHHDWRFFKSMELSADNHLQILHGLISAWLRFTNANDITTWIAHGSLLGWYWSGLSFPWDSDFDVQVPIFDLHKLSRNFNQTVIVDVGADSSPEVRLGRYFLDCGTWISHREAGNGLNNIDARFIDMDSGLYIDITALAVSANISPGRYDKQFPKGLYKPMKQRVMSPDPSLELHRNNVGQLYNCRNRHVSSLLEISPLRLTLMEGVPAYVPHKFTDILQAEYGKKSIDSQKFWSYTFLPKLRIWAKARKMARYARDTKVRGMKIELGSNAKDALQSVDKHSIYTFSDQEYLELMSTDKDLLFQYLITKEVTAFHQKEMKLLLQGMSTENLFSESLPLFKHLYPDYNNYVAVKENRDFIDHLSEYLEMYHAFK